jgi:plasmid stabilization system protein ParE
MLPQSEIDLLDIGRHIAAENLTAAYAVIDAIQQECELLATSSEMGALAQNSPFQLRSFPVGR